MRGKCKALRGPASFFEKKSRCNKTLTVIQLLPPPLPLMKQSSWGNFKPHEYSRQKRQGYLELKLRRRRECPATASVIHCGRSPFLMAATKTGTHTHLTFLSFFSLFVLNRSKVKSLKTPTLSTTESWWCTFSLVFTHFSSKEILFD